MRVYPLSRCLRCKRVLALLFIVILITISVKMGSYFSNSSRVEYTFVHDRRYIFLNPLSTNFSIGSFLKGRRPLNTSFCVFRFGDSENFTFSEEDAFATPELSDKSQYRVLYGVVEGVRFNRTEPFTVTYVTHVTLEFLFHLVELVTRWEGSVSVACFLPGSDAGVALQHLEKMCSCVPEMQNINVHLVYHVNHPPKPRNFSESFNSSLPNDNKCFVPEAALRNGYKKRHGLVYPVNVARNVARLGARSEFVLVSDVELFPSENLVPEFLKMITRLRDRSKNLGDHYFTKKKHVFVVPVFEVAEDEPDVPRTKPHLLDLYARQKAVYFHRYVCLHCQRFPGLQRWLQRKINPRTKLGVVQPMLVVKREFPYHRWEPIYIGTNQEPLYSEVLTWEGQQDKMTQMHEMCLLDYRFVILNGAFLVHTPGMKRRRDKAPPLPKTTPPQKTTNRTTSSSPNLETLFSRTATRGPGQHTWRNEHVRRNEYLYQLITQDVIGKYKNNPRCRIH